MTGLNTNMRILARKCQPLRPKCQLSKARYGLLKARYLVCKKIPAAYFSAASWLYGKHLALRDKVVTGRWYRLLLSLVLWQPVNGIPGCGAGAEYGSDSHPDYLRETEPL